MKNSIINGSSPLESTTSIGGKGANLYKLSNREIPVPRWFCVDAAVFSDAVSERADEINKIFSHIDFSSQSSLIKASEKLKEIVFSLEIKPEVAELIHNELKNNFDENTYFAVRSSAIGEDSEKDSFAGQLDTYLFVSPHLITEYIKKCWASAFNAGLLTYINFKGGNISQLKVAVIVQKMLFSKSSGVMFLANPNGNLNETVIVAGYGMGEGIVSDIVETDTYYYDKTSKRIRSNVSRKLSRVIFDADKKSGTIKAGVNEEDQTKPVLTAAQITRLAEMGQKISKIYEKYQDIEWAFDEEDNLFILQSRPITTLPEGDTLVFDNSNIVESYPGITAPLTFSFIQEVYYVIFRDFMKRLGIPEKTTRQDERFLKNLLGYMEGRVYYNLANWYETIKYVPFSNKFIPVWKEMLGIKDDSDKKASNSFLTQVKHSLYGISSLLSMVWNFITLNGKMKSFKKMFAGAAKTFHRVYKNDLDNDSLLKLFDYIKGREVSGWEITLFNDIYAFIFSFLARAIIKKAGIDENENIFNDLLCGVVGIESVEPVVSIVRMTEVVRGCSPLHEVLEAIALKENTVASVIEKVRSASLCTSQDNRKQMENFIELFKGHIDKFGSRTLEELKLESKSYSDDPGTLLQRILSYVPMEIKVDEMEKKQLEIREKAEKAVNSKIGRKFLTRMAFSFTLRMAKRSISYRESSRLDRARLYDIVRKVFTSIGNNLYKERIIALPGDIFYLTTDEIFNYIRGSSVNQRLQDTIDMRKKYKEEYKTRKPVEKFVWKGNIYKGNIPQKNDGFYHSQGDINVLKGTGCSMGRVTAQAAIVREPSTTLDIKGKILVTEATDPGWVFLIVVSSGIIVEKGSLLSHTAIISRELGIPAIVGVKDATSIIKDGATITLDGNSGEVLLNG